MWRRPLIKSGKRSGCRRQAAAVVRETAVILALMICFSGCALMEKRGLSDYPVMPFEVESGEIEELELALSAMTGEAADKARQSDQALILLKLAMLYSHEKNPSPDLERAVECLERFISLEAAPRVDARYAISLLHRIRQCQSARPADQARANDKIRQLENRLRVLLDENREKTDIIEKLKHLDVKLEKKRGDFD